jgi:mRNA interferase YafQ
VRTVSRSSKFKKDQKRVERRGKNLASLLKVVEFLVLEGELPASYKPHPLVGNWSDCLECHIEPDWLLIYQVTEREVILYRTGTHSDLFKK